jgi:hypothetical protein
MAEVCVSRNLSITAGVLGLEAWSVPRLVLDATYNSTGDGTFTTPATTLPGRLMIDSGVQSWVNTSPLDANVLLRIQRARRDWWTSNPNAIQIRDRYTYTLNGDTPRTPDTSSTYHGQSGSSGDVGADSGATPYAAVFYEYEDGTMLEDWITVPAGETLKIWYRAYMWTPPPWSNNANNNAPTHSVNIYNTRIVMMAFPTQDTAVLP